MMNFQPLLKPETISNQNWPEKQIALAYVQVLTYNHVNYIRDCIEGILMQKTTFPVKIVVFDDCSNDGTTEIIKTYSEQYPELFKLFIQPENTYKKSIRKKAVQEWYEYASSGKYIAKCEGDDYWTDPLKLQKQVDFLEEHEDCSLCFHASKNIRNNNPEDYSIHKPSKIPQDYKFEMKHAILAGGGFMATNSMLFRSKYVLDRPQWMQEAPVGDGPLMLLLASKGRIGYIDDVMSVYRIMSSPTSWSASMQNPLRKKEHYYAILKMWRDFDKWSNGKYHKYVVKKIRFNRNTYLKGKVKNILNRIIR